MSEFSDDLQQTAAELLTEFGQEVTLTKAGSPTYDPATGTTTNAGGGAQTVMGAVFEYSTFIRQGVRNEPGSLIKAGDKQVFLASTASDGTALVAPAADDVVTIGATDFTITAVATISPAGTVLYYDCNVRGA